MVKTLIWKSTFKQTDQFYYFHVDNLLGTQNLNKNTKVTRIIKLCNGLHF